MTSNLQFTNVSFAYDSMHEPLFTSTSFSISNGWTGVVGPNGCGKSTLLLLATGQLTCDSGSISGPADGLYAEQRTDFPSALARSFIDADDGEAWRLKGVLEIEYDWLDRWNSLSHGERKRLQIGACLWAAPSMLAIDEPTNHLDGQARRLIEESLTGYRGVGLLVSHDRELLDTITRRTIIVTDTTVELRSGSFTTAWSERKREVQEMRDRYQNERKSLEKLRKEEHRRRRLAAEQHARRSKKGIPIKDHDARYKKNIARISGKDGVGGKLLRQMDGRLSQSENRLASFRTEKDRKLGISLESVRAQSDALYTRPPFRLTLGETRALELPELTIEPASRIGVTGPNGSGKSTLIRHIIDNLDLSGRNYLYIPQEIPIDESARLRSAMLELSTDELGKILAIVSRLGTEPEHLMGSVFLSPGESRKLMLAMGIHSGPEIIVMDEPTNHMDIPSVECLESSLADARCAMLLVSHDLRFLSRLVTTYWRVAYLPGSGSSRITVEAV